MPKGIWEIDARDVCRLRPDPGGLLFTAFVDEIIGAQAHLNGVPSANLHGNLRTNKPDGGVDTAVDVGLDDQDPWFDRPTAWQFKSCEAHDVSEADLRDEIKKDYAAELISKGYAYRLCICDELPAEQKSEWESELLGGAKELTEAPAVPRVLAAWDLAKWANNFPGVILSHFQPFLATLAQNFRKWGESITNLTRTYVPVPNWQTLQERLGAHCNFSVRAHSVVFPLKGVAGVGKSRFVHEVLRGLEGARFLVVYAQDRHFELATYLANHNAAALLVADECSPEAEFQLEDTLRGQKERVRVVAIRNDARPPVSGAPEFTLTQMSEQECENVLTANYPDIPRDARRDYARLCQGFIRLAADMCEEHANIAEAGHPGPALERVRGYFERRIPDEPDRTAVEALALLPKVGYAEDVSEQLALLCKMVGLESATVINVARRLHDRPGFVAKTTRFLYVTPQIIAQVAFWAAWRRWIQDNPRQFFGSLPESLLAEFQERVKTTALPEARKALADFFFDWAVSLRPAGLADTASIARLIALTEIEPEVYLDCLYRLISDASDDEIRSISNEARGWVSTGSRRNLVWLLERLVWFPEYFDRSEEILLRLATNETEPDIGNNASAIWARLYSAALPGTAVPFDQRIARLRERLVADDPRVSSLAFTALEGVFRVSAFRSDVSALGGRVRPREANPRTDQEWSEYLQAALSVVAEMSGSLNRTLRVRAQRTAARNLRALLQMGYLEQVQQILKPGEIEEENLAESLNNIDEFLHFEVDLSSAAFSEYLDTVRAWRRRLQPSSLHARLVSSVGIEPWRPSMVGEDSWRAELRELARILAGDSKLLGGEMPWLCSGDAKGAAYLGEELAKADVGARLLETIIQAAVRHNAGALARGYLIGALRNPALDLAKLNSLLDAVEAANPSLAFDLFRVGGSMTRAVERTISLVDEGELALTYLRSFTAVWDFQPDVRQLGLVLNRLLAAAEGGDVPATEIALDIFGSQITKMPESLALLEDEDIQRLAWRFAEVAARNPGREAHWWGELLKRLAQFDSRRALGLAAIGLVNTGLNQSYVAAELLTEAARDHPDQVVDELGSLILDDSRGGWRILIRKYPIFAVLPWEVVARWVKDHGVEAAKRVAGQLPLPKLDDTGSPVVPPLTEYVLTEFEDSDEVFRAFVGGAHNLQSYVGDIAGQHDREAEVATKFLNHRLRRIREWAVLEIGEAKAEAGYWRRVEEEARIP